AAGAHAAACPAAPAVVQVARRLVPPRAFLTVLVRFPRRSTPFPYTTLFRSRRRCRGGRQLGRRRQHAHGRVGPGRGRTRRHGRRGHGELGRATAGAGDPGGFGHPARADGATGRTGPDG